MAREDRNVKANGKDSKVAAKNTEAKRAPPPRESPDFGVPALAEHMGIQPASVRVLLRNAGIEKDGGTYDFKSQKGVEAIAKQLRANEAKGSDKDPPAKGKAESKSEDRRARR